MLRVFSRGQSIARWLGLLLALTTLGCARLGHRKQHCPPNEGTIQYPLPETQRGTLSPDLSDMGSLADVNAILGQRSGHAYRALTPRQCQCLASEASTLGNLFEGDRRSVIASAAKKRKGLSCSEKLKADILAIAALEARNKSAADALDLYYRIAEAETQRDMSVISLREMNSAVEKLERMRSQGLQVTLDDSELFRQRNELGQKQVDLAGALARLNIELRRQLGFMVDDDTWRIWPMTDLTVVVERQDADEAVATGMQLRPEIALLMHLQHSFDPQTVDVVRQALGSLAGLSGTSESSKSCKLLQQIHLKKEAKQKEAEFPQRKRQLDDYSQSRQQHIAAEIRQSVATIELRLQQIALAKEHLSYASERVRELEGRNTAGKSNFLELTLARLQQQQAKADVVSRVVAWKIADVRLRENQGKLVDECIGFCAETDIDNQPHEAFPPGEIIHEEPVLPPAVREPALKELPPPQPVIEEPLPVEVPPGPALPEDSADDEPRLLPPEENTITFSLPETFEPRDVGKETQANYEVRKTNGKR
jgi:hypothetical protein